MYRAVGGITLIALLMVLSGLSCRPFNGNAQTPRKRDGFAEDRPEEAKPCPFDGKRALGYLQALCKIGPRISGSAGMKKQQDMLEKHFKDHGAVVSRQSFKVRQRSADEDTPMVNLIASWQPKRERRVILCSHYDTRPIADEEKNHDHWHKPFLSANDGGSGVALLMELAHHVKDIKTNVGVDFVFFDGEEFIFDRQRDLYFFGSKHFGQQYRKARDKKFYAAAILLDMVGAKKPHFPLDPYSYRHATDLLMAVWTIAREQGCAAFNMDAFGRDMLDDHIALNENGIPAIDIIDSQYPHWHKLTDLTENCCGDSMAQVAKVLTAWLQRVK